MKPKCFPLLSLPKDVFQLVLAVVPHHALLLMLPTCKRLYSLASAELRKRPILKERYLFYKKVAYLYAKLCTKYDIHRKDLAWRLMRCSYRGVVTFNFAKFASVSGREDLAEVPPMSMQLEWRPEAVRLLREVAAFRARPPETAEEGKVVLLCALEPDLNVLQAALGALRLVYERRRYTVVQVQAPDPVDPLPLARELIEQWGVPDVHPFDRGCPVVVGGAPSPALLRACTVYLRYKGLVRTCDLAVVAVQKKTALLGLLLESRPLGGRLEELVVPQTELNFHHNFGPQGYRFRRSEIRDWMRFYFFTTSKKNPHLNLPWGPSLKPREWDVVVSDDSLEKMNIGSRTYKAMLHAQRLLVFLRWLGDARAPLSPDFDLHRVARAGGLLIQAMTISYAEPTIVSACISSFSHQLNVFSSYACTK